MNMYKSYQFRLYPNDKQIIMIQKTFGCTRFVYNHYLEKRKKEHLTCFDMIKDLPNLYSEYPFLKEVDSCSLRCSLFDLEDAFKRFIKHQNNYPKFKGKYSSKRSYRTNYITSTYKGRKYENIKVDLKRKVITLPQLKEVKIRGYRNLESLPGRIINATISEYSSGKYYVSVLVEVNHLVAKIIPKRIVGIDLGIKDVVITSDGEKIKNEKIIEKYEKRIKRKQRELARREKGSSNYYKTKRKHDLVFTTDGIVSVVKDKVKNITPYNEVKLKGDSLVFYCNELVPTKDYKVTSLDINILYDLIRQLGSKFIRNFDNKMEYLEGIITVDALNKWFKEQPESMTVGVTKVYAIPTADIMKSFGYHCEDEIDPDKNLLQFFYDEKTKDILGLRIVHFDNIDSNFQSVLMERNGIVKVK